MSGFVSDHERDWTDVMQVCRNGHKITGEAKANPEDLVKRCPKCGAETITQCPACQSDIPGYRHLAGIFSEDDTQPPAFCHNCGRPFPWYIKLPEDVKRTILQAI